MLHNILISSATKTVDSLYNGKKGGVIMELNKTEWRSSDRASFLAYLKSFEQETKVDWARRILNTKMPLLAIPTKIIDQIAKKIFKGNYPSFLDLHIDDYYESIAIQGKLITKIKDFDIMKRYLDRYATVMENWAHCDLLSFDIHPENQSKFIDLSYGYRHSTQPFIRRLSLMILFQMIKDTEILPIIYEALLALEDEQDYYVIMMAGWLLSECIIQHKTPTLTFIQNQKLNPKVVNKGIQKCRESLRLSKAEKDDLLIFKREKNHKR
jgi:3-methyladenine DNA glycosylase AlkD